MTWHREAIIEAGTPVYRNPDGTIEPASTQDCVFGVAMSDSVQRRDSHYVEVETR